MSSGSGEVGDPMPDIVRETEIVSVCGTNSTQTPRAERLMAFILRKENNAIDEAEQEPSWLNFLKSIKKKLESEPRAQRIFKVLKNGFMSMGGTNKMTTLNYKIVYF